MRVQLDNVCSHQLPLEPRNHFDHLARTEPTRLMMRHPWRKGRIVSIQIQRQINRSIELGRQIRAPVAHVYTLDPKAFGLLALMRVHRGDAHLHKAYDLPHLHHPRKGSAMPQWPDVLLIIEVRMGVNVQHIEPLMAIRRALDQRERHRRITTQRQKPFQPRARARLDRGNRLWATLLEHIQIARVLDPVRRTQICAILSRWVDRA